MGRVWRVAGVQLVILGEYLLAAAALLAVAYLVVSAPRPAGCVDSCFGQGLFPLLLILAGLAVLAVGLPVALLIATVLQNRRRRRSLTGRPVNRREIVPAATKAAVLGAVIAVPLLCILGPLVQLLR